MEPLDPGREDRAVRAARRVAFTRVFADSDGVEWEVYDDGASSVALALDFDHLPQRSGAGLLFTSSKDRRRFWPAPDGWQLMDDRELMKLCEEAVSVR
jgi:hypothetical protein